jgi:hypothetical protein
MSTTTDTFGRRTTDWCTTCQHLTTNHTDDCPSNPDTPTMTATQQQARHPAFSAAALFTLGLTIFTLGVMWALATVVTGTATLAAWPTYMALGGPVMTLAALLFADTR